MLFLPLLLLRALRRRRFLCAVVWRAPPCRAPRAPAGVCDHGGRAPAGGAFKRPWEHSGWDKVDPESVKAQQRGEHWPSYKKFIADGGVTNRHF